jgi:hypothetical protein
VTFLAPRFFFALVGFALLLLYWRAGLVVIAMLAIDVLTFFGCGMPGFAVL